MEIQQRQVSVGGAKCVGVLSRNEHYTLAFAFVSTTTRAHPAQQAATACSIDHPAIPFRCSCITHGDCSPPYLSSRGRDWHHDPLHRSRQRSADSEPTPTHQPNQTRSCVHPPNRNEEHEGTPRPQSVSEEIDHMKLRERWSRAEESARVNRECH